MKTGFKLFASIFVIGVLFFIVSCNQEMSLKDKYEIVHNDVDYKAFSDGVKKSMQLTATNYFGVVKVDQKNIEGFKDEANFIEYLRTTGMQHPDEYVKLYNGIFSAYKRLFEKHEFLREMSKEERDDFFDGMSDEYPDAKFDPMYIFKTLQDSRKN